MKKRADESAELWTILVQERNRLMAQMPLPVPAKRDDQTDAQYADLIAATLAYRADPANMAAYCDRVALVLAQRVLARMQAIAPRMIYTLRRMARYDPRFFETEYSFYARRAYGAHLPGLSAAHALLGQAERLAKEK